MKDGLSAGPHQAEEVFPGGPVKGAVASQGGPSGALVRGAGPFREDRPEGSEEAVLEAENLSEDLVAAAPAVGVAGAANKDHYRPKRQESF